MLPGPGRCGRRPGLSSPFYCVSRSLPRGGGGGVPEDGPPPRPHDAPGSLPALRDVLKGIFFPIFFPHAFSSSWRTAPSRTGRRPILRASWYGAVQHQTRCNGAGCNERLFGMAERQNLIIIVAAYEALPVLVKLTAHVYHHKGSLRTQIRMAPSPEA